MSCTGTLSIATTFIPDTTEQSRGIVSATVSPPDSTSQWLVDQLLVNLRIETQQLGANRVFDSEVAWQTWVWGRALKILSDNPFSNSWDIIVEDQTSLSIKSEGGMQVVPGDAQASVKSEDVDDAMEWEASA